jgi:hypothetical protein
VVQTSEAGTKEKTNSHFSRGERGDAEEQPNSHSLTETRRHGGTERKDQVKTPQQPIARGGTAQTKNPSFLSFLRASVREWLLEISFCHKKKLKISVQRNNQDQIPVYWLHLLQKSTVLADCCPFVIPAGW